MTIAVSPKELSNSLELQKVIVKHFMIRYWKIIKHSSYNDRTGYNPSWIQEAFYNHTKVVVD